MARNRKEEPWLPETSAEYPRTRPCPEYVYPSDDGTYRRYPNMSRGERRTTWGGIVKDPGDCPNLRDARWDFIREW